MKNNYVGILFFSSFFIIGLYPLQSGGSIRAWSIILSLVFLLIIIIKPNLFIFLNILCLKFGILLRKIISSIIMVFLFYCLILDNKILKLHPVLLQHHLRLAGSKYF